MTEIELMAPAKINLALDVKGIRPDGYHDVQMIMQSISLADRIFVKRTRGESRITSSVTNIPLDGNNIAMKAWLLMKSRFGLPGELAIHIEKKIPVEAGLAGGSTNAAAVLKGVNVLFDLNLENFSLAKIGAELGADVPFCVFGGTALAEGIGEILTPLPSPPKIWLCLVNPGYGVSTAKIYQQFDSVNVDRHPDISGVVKAINTGNTRLIMEKLLNVLENVTLSIYPELVNIKSRLSEMGLFPLMSGSGPTILGLAETEDKVLQAASELRGKWKFVGTAHTV
ncbi:MAG: 4-(cytidine 5'-diphospho)-2-C-methyl-D-erythritol kinase [Desulfitobacteriaceae bacterium]|nr:4-(cytidine 5'-diphospho)-2-C-methyl-D-erythritol kinase [Desulfitobacteriaceae bacterium]MDD4752282.1 4-(cytidine 5'-diphospho)-2-C-methyl-D-erythritol kinase [Desulfitobacteriaceae bacterium]